MNPKVKRFQKQYGAAADAIARLDIDQTTRERVVDALTEAFSGQPDFIAATFRLVASDPLCRCAGPDEEPFAQPCPYDREIRVPMHLRDASNGRSDAWYFYKPVVRCVTCGADAFIPQPPRFQTTHKEQPYV